MNCTGLETIYCNTPTPPYTAPIVVNPWGDDDIEHVIFYNVPSDIPVYVNCLAIEQFESHSNWMQFTNLQGVFMGAPSLTVEVNNPEYGTAEVLSIPEDCDHTTATVRAIPYEGHVFGCWKRGNAVVSYDPEYSFTLNQNRSLTACFDVAVFMIDSIGYPDHVIGRQFNAENQVYSEYISDFQYTQNGRLYYFSFPSYHIYTSIFFFDYPTKPSRIYTIYGSKDDSDENLKPDPPTTSETITFTYGSDHQIEHRDEYYSEINEDFTVHYDYFYDNHRLTRKDISRTEHYDTWMIQRNRYAYENEYRIQIDSAYTFVDSTRLLSVAIKQFNERQQVLSSQTVTYNKEGIITSGSLKTYTYNDRNKTDSIITQTLNQGDWINSEYAHYVYDDKYRVVEYQTGSWFSEKSEWNISKKTLYDFDDDMQKVTISFRKKENNSWVWDVFRGQTLFYDSQLYEWQRQMGHYVLNVHQFEISMHYNTVELSFPILSEWYYEILNDDGSITYQHLEYTADTAIADDKAKVIVRTNQIYDKDKSAEVTHEYIKEQDNKVYWWNKELQEFTTLYDYNAQAGDEWEIKVGLESIMVHVDTVEAFEYQVMPMIGSAATLS